MMPLISKPNYNQIFASQAPDQDKPAVFNNYPLGWGVESRPNNGKPTIKGFNYLQQTSDLKDLWILQNGACLPYDESIEYAEGAPVLKDGVIQYKVGSGFKSRDSVTIPTYSSAADGVDPVIGVADGAYFNVRSSSDDSYVDEYQNVSGIAVATGKSYLSALGVQQQEKSASTIKDASGQSQQDINDSQPVFLSSYSVLRGYNGNKSVAQVGGRLNYFDGGFGRFSVKASDNTSADNDGTILVDAKGRRWHRIIETEYGNPEWFGMSESVADNAPLVEKCLNIVGSAFIRRGEFPIQNTLRVLAGQTLIGQVDKSIFVINDSTKPGILTHDYSTNNGVAKTQQGMSIESIRVKGNAKFGFGFTHCTQGDFSGLSIDGLTATDGYIFEGLWNCHFNDFKSNGAVLTGSAFKINKVVLNSEFKSLYASNLCDYTLNVDSTRSEISNNTWLGFGDLIIEGLAAQGANKSAINLVQANNIIFNGLYTENCLAALHIGTAQTITFNTCSFVGIRSASSLYEMWLGYSSSNTMNGIVFNQCRHSSNNYPIVIDYAGLGIVFNQPLVTLNTPLINKIRRTSRTNGGIPISIYRDSGGTGTTDVKKTNNYAWKFVVESVNDNNVVTRTTVIPPEATMDIVI